jgi:hypothetical protein
MILRMHAIDGDDDIDHQKVGDAFRYSVVVVVSSMVLYQ